MVYCSLSHTTFEQKINRCAAQFYIRPQLHRSTLSSRQPSAISVSQPVTRRHGQQLTTVTYAECPEPTLGKITSLSSVAWWTLSKESICRVSFADTRQSIILFFSTNLFVVCYYSMQTYMFKFGTIIEMFSIHVRFSSFN